MVVHISTCCDNKGKNATAAKNLYTSARFKKIKKIIGDDKWFILSSLYGVCEPDEILYPYDVSMTNFSLAEKRRWRDDVLSELKRLLPAGCKVIFWGGLMHRHTIVDGLKSRGHEVELPLMGLDIGMQLKKLNELVAQKEKGTEKT